MTFVKICGLTQPAHLEAALAAGADFVGLMFAEQSRRRITVEQARSILAVLPVREEPLPALPLPPGHTGTLWFDRCAAALERLAERRRPLTVGVFVNQPASLVNPIAETLGLDLVQLHGDEPWEDCLLIRRPVIKAERVGAGDTASAVAFRAEAGTASLVMLDAAVAGQYGGTGEAFDWEIAHGVAERLPVMLAGGLHAGNVAEAIARVRPWAVDVSSGVETGGTKDVEKIAAFVAAARAADERRRAAATSREAGA
jgi:phosphoribosylanthranilate isomerase